MSGFVDLLRANVEKASQGLDDLLADRSYIAGTCAATAEDFLCWAAIPEEPSSTLPSSAMVRSHRRASAAEAI